MYVFLLLSSILAWALILVLGFLLNAAAEQTPIEESENERTASSRQAAVFRTSSEGAPQLEA